MIVRSVRACSEWERVGCGGAGWPGGRAQGAGGVRGVQSPVSVHNAHPWALAFPHRLFVALSTSLCSWVDKVMRLKKVGKKLGVWCEL